MSNLLHALDPFPHRAWPLPVVPVSGAVPPVLDHILGDAAFAALAGDAIARDALFAAFRPRLGWSIRRCQLIWSGQSNRFVEDAIEPNDIDQEAYLVFAELIADWTPGGSFSAYVLGQFPWRMNRVLRRWRRQRGPRAVRSIARVIDERSPIEQAELTVLVDALAARLDPTDADLLRRRVLDDASFDDIAKRAGISRRTLHRRWRAIADLVERAIAPSKAG